MSYAGRRALVSFKHVGLNVAADPFMNSAVTGVDGGLVVAVADDPGMHSSQNEQDSRVYAQFALIPCLEPANGQEAYDMTREAFELSERFGLPGHAAAGHPHRAQPQRRRPRREAAAQPARADHATRTTGRSCRPTRAWASRALPPSRRSCVALVRDLALEPAAPGPERRAGGRHRRGHRLNYFLRELRPRRALPPHLQIGAYPIPVGLVGSCSTRSTPCSCSRTATPFIESALRGLFGLPGQGDPRPPRRRRAADRRAHPRHRARRARASRRPRQQPPAAAARPAAPVPLRRLPAHRHLRRPSRSSSTSSPSARVFGDIGCYTLGASRPTRPCHACIDMGATHQHGDGRRGRRACARCSRPSATRPSCTRG